MFDHAHDVLGQLSKCVHASPGAAAANATDWGLQTAESYSPTVLEAKSLKSGCQQVPTPSRGLQEGSFLPLPTLGVAGNLWLHVQQVCPFPRMKVKEERWRRGA